MKKVFITSPISIAGCLITHGFAEAFRQLGYFVVEKDVRETTFEEIEKFNPDYILGYCYGYMVNESLLPKLRNNSKYKFIHYFGDEPDSKFAYTDNPELYEIMKKTKAEIFIWDPEFTTAFKSSHYLPLGVDPKLYKSHFDKYEHKISFVGRPLTPKRQAILVTLIKAFGPISLYCYRDHFERSINEIVSNNLFTTEELDWYKASYKGFLKKESEMAHVYNSSKININITEQGLNNINYRVFEVLASSGFLLTDNMPDLCKNFDVGRELDVFSNEAELIDKIKFYLNNLDIAQTIARNGRKNIVNNHSFKDRTTSILKIIEA